MQFKKLELIIRSFFDENNPLVGTENGLVYGNPKEITKAGVCWSPNYNLIKQAIKDKVELLIIHEPLFFNETHCDCFSLSEIPFEQKIQNIKRKKLLDENNITVYRSHSDLDEAQESNSFVLAELYGAKIDSKIEYGVVGDIDQKPFRELIDFTKKALGTAHVKYVGNPDKNISRVAFVAGGGARFIEIVDQAIMKNAQMLISGDLVDNTGLYAIEGGLFVIDPGHYFSENVGIKHFSENLRKKVPEVDFIFYNSHPGVYIK